jgi:hypothetical protein
MPELQSLVVHFNTSAPSTAWSLQNPHGEGRNDAGAESTIAPSSPMDNTVEDIALTEIVRTTLHRWNDNTPLPFLPAFTKGRSTYAHASTS